MQKNIEFSFWIDKKPSRAEFHMQAEFMCKELWDFFVIVQIPQYL